MAESGRETLALVPLRAGSKGLPGKNTRELAGKPLWRHAVDQARAAGIARVLVSTDIGSLLSAPPEQDLQLCPRPAALAGDTVPMDAVLRHVLAHDVTGPATIVLLQATSPLRRPADITAALELHVQGDFDLVLSATRADSGVLKWGKVDGAAFVPLSDPAHCFANRAELPPVYRPNGAVYVFDAGWFRSSGTLAGGRIGMVEMPPERAADIDNSEDFAAVESRLRDTGGDPA
ncbi:acylneuraminate cytidylyltransferase family protein [Salibaculum sp.]|uniref:acylneuraminate cytidylyltransferase family protein n=1 Tax=Salibaculum sp. TaxID=2855480 RepID=UPI002B477991|nr:acylneuraminate cytidylyltransferase family protein [Salibaculum sp.]HKL69555.1 acylneuraminate cytidylyltransferase family protein [Salibaculum sp.]